MQHGTSHLSGDRDGTTKAWAGEGEEKKGNELRNDLETRKRKERREERKTRRDTNQRGGY